MPTYIFRHQKRLKHLKIKVEPGYRILFDDEEIIIDKDLARIRLEEDRQKIIDSGQNFTDLLYKLDPKHHPNDPKYFKFRMKTVQPLPPKPSAADYYPKDLDPMDYIGKLHTSLLQYFACY